MFVTSGYIGGEREFWWDELERLILLPGDLPKRLELDVAGIQYQFEFGELQHYSRKTFDLYRAWKVMFDRTPPPTERHALFLALWHTLQKTSEENRRAVLRHLIG